MQSSRTIIRRLEQSDLGGIRDLESNLEVMKFTGLQKVQSLEQSKQRLVSQIENQSKLEPFGIWIAEHKSSKDFIGWFMLMPYEVQKLELGFMITQKNFGQGLCTEISKVLLDYAANFKNITAVVALTALENHSSMRVLQKLGFRELETVTLPNKVLGGNLELRKFEIAL